jgi:hypothetical protein
MEVRDAAAHHRDMRQLLPWVTTGVGLIVLLSGTSAGFGWALVVVGAALIADPGSGGTRSRPRKRVAVRR